MYGPGYGNGWMHGSWMFGGPLMLLIWLVIVGVAIALVVQFARRKNPDAGHSALDILNERYARGEIGKEEFEQKRRDIRG